MVIGLLAAANVRITDYSHSRYIPIVEGNVLVWEQKGYVRHCCNLTELAAIKSETGKLSETFPYMCKLLDVDLDHAWSLLSVLREHHRIARTLDFLGTARF